MRRRLLTIVAASSLGGLVACAPKPGERIPLAERACLAAAAAESSAIADQRQVDLAQAQIAEKETRLVELQRLRSRLVTHKITDEEFVHVALEPKPPEPTPTDTTHAAPTDTTQTASMDTTQAATLPVGEASQTSTDTTGVATSPDTTRAAPTDTTGVATPPATSTEQPPSDEQHQTDQIQNEPASGENQQAPSSGTEEQSAPQAQPEENASAAGDTTGNAEPERAP